jgi:hypothetical protein
MHARGQPIKVRVVLMRGGTAKDGLHLPMAVHDLSKAHGVKDE